MPEQWGSMTWAARCLACACCLQHGSPQQVHELIVATLPLYVRCNPHRRPTHLPSPPFLPFIVLYHTCQVLELGGNQLETLPAEVGWLPELHQLGLEGNGKLRIPAIVMEGGFR